MADGLRLSSDPSDPGYGQWMVAKANGKNVRVFLDCVEVRHCTVADESLGYVRRAVLDDDGRVQIDPNNPDQVWEEDVRGCVEIVVEPGPEEAAELDAPR